MGIAKWEMSQGDNELWGDYMVRTTAPAISLENVSPLFGVEVLLALVPLDDVGIGWSESPFRSNVSIWSSLNSQIYKDFECHTVPLGAPLLKSAAKSWIAGTPPNRSVIVLKKWILQEDAEHGLQPTASFQLSYETANGSAGWYALVLLARRLEEIPP